MKSLFVDANSFNGYFFNKDSGPSFWKIDEYIRRTSAFIDAAKRGGYEVTCFYDYDHMGSVDFEKWKSRRANEVRYQKKGIPPHFPNIITETLLKLGTKILFTGAPGCDIILASFAQKAGAVILSQDSDLMAYKGTTYKVYKRFGIRNGKLQLEEEGIIRDKTKDLLTDLSQAVLYDPKTMMIKRLEKTKNIELGVPSPLVKYLGNPHQIITPLRQAFYHKENLPFPINELMCEWDAEKNDVCWKKTLVEPKGDLAFLLKNPMEAIQYFFKNFEKPENFNKIDWENHLFGVAISVIDLCRDAYPEFILTEELKKAQKMFKRPFNLEAADDKKESVQGTNDSIEERNSGKIIEPSKGLNNDGIEESSPCKIIVPSKDLNENKASKEEPQGCKENAQIVIATPGSKKIDNAIARGEADDSITINSAFISSPQLKMTKPLPVRAEQESFVYFTKCKICKKEIKLTEDQVISYEKKGWLLPKKHSKCKQAEKRKQFRKKKEKIGVTHSYTSKCYICNEEIKFALEMVDAYKKKGWQLPKQHGYCNGYRSQSFSIEKSKGKRENYNENNGKSTNFRVSFYKNYHRVKASAANSN